MKKIVKYRSYAKINLFLEILSKRDDGFHEIRTVFSLIDVYDHLNFVLTKNSGIKILADTDSLKEEDNLVYKLAVFIKKAYNVKLGVKAELEKNIPIAAGLGGGSSNAAATICALNLLWDLRLSDSEMHSLAAEWGSDINFFLSGSTALGQGRGEIITPLPYLEYDNIFLVNPGFGIPSSQAYQSAIFSEARHSSREFLADPVPENCFNRLEAGMRKKYSQIDEIIRNIESFGASKALLSGSGATVIGFCPDRETAEKLCQYYNQKGYWNTITKTKGEPNEHYRC
jgi:4-diphosphocytidyl-2-C-methyl-D-erythritol kinase